MHYALTQSVYDKGFCGYPSLHIISNILRKFLHVYLKLLTNLLIMELQAMQHPYKAARHTTVPSVGDVADSILINTHLTDISCC